jgi:hypothetical protein
MFLPCRGCSLTAVSSLNPENKSKINSARSEPPFLKPAQIKIPKINLKEKGLKNNEIHPLDSIGNPVTD